MDIITTTDGLAAFAGAMRRGDFITVDTEFMREKTYWPILCLIQVAGADGEAIIDPMADGISLEPLFELLAAADLTKVFHAARQDVEIFHNLSGAIPTPLFDTQVAAMACGYGDQIGYEPLMRSLVSAKIDKGSRFTDWSRRPLTDAQLDYALSDVTYLREAYPILRERLVKEDRMRWVDEEMEILRDPDLYLVKPEDAWRRMKLKGVRPADLGPLIKLAEWREREAQTRDVPRSRILKDDALFELARMKPKSPKEMARARSVGGGFERSKQAESLLAAIETGASLDRDTLPKIAKTERRNPPPADVVDLLKVLLKRQCEVYEVAPKLIANTADLEELALHDAPDIQALKGWRREIFGDIALKLKSGDIALRLNGEGIDIVELG